MVNDAKDEGVEEIAVIGMAGRFPGAADLDVFWQNLRAGIDAIRPLDDETLGHVPRALLDKPNYVKAGAILDGVELFDAAFFKLTPREATLMDPQQRLFLECCWHVLEHAGYGSESGHEATGVFAGTGANYYLNHLLRDPALLESIGEMQLGIGNGSDHFATRASFLLNLGGPGISVQTTCSTSLVAVHLACQSLINYECDMALAGGCSVAIPQVSGYLHQEDGILSADGRCRTFDAAASGTVRGSGVGVVLLKRLTEAIADGDHIHAVIMGSAVNNDGAAKMGYTAPSVEGQRRVIQEALAVADVDPQSIGYVEAHGTATALGDPIEVEALTQAFGSASHSRYCGLGSVKSNIGHCDAAAGIAGFLKTVLCLENQTLVPSLHFEKPNPRIDFDNSPFYVCTQSQPWQQRERRAGVSSFGIGGTNAHVILRQATKQKHGGSSRACQVVALSAMTESALDAKRAQLNAYFEQNPEVSLADAAFTLNLGRKAMPYRQAFVAGDVAALRDAMKRTAPTAKAPERSPDLVFLFPGQGKRYEDLGHGLFRDEPLFRREVETCSEILAPRLGVSLAEIMYPAKGLPPETLYEPQWWQPAMFVAEYALARLWLSWGLRPKAMMGHSVGEYVAAVLAGVFSLEDGLALVAWRGRATSELPSGAMLAVVADERALSPHLDDSISLAAVNGPKLCVVSGPDTAIEALAETLKKARIRAVRLEATHAFHSGMMDPLRQPLTRLVESFTLRPPEIPFVSNVTGTWMTEEDAVDPGYWARHLRKPVRFHEGVELLLREREPLFLEVGPGDVLTRLVESREGVEAAAIASLRRSSGSLADALTALGGLWCRGVPVDWRAFYKKESRRRLALPVYPFERRSFWFEERELPPTAAVADPLTVKRELKDWFYLPMWRPAPLLSRGRANPETGKTAVWLFFLDGRGIGASLANRIEALGAKVIRVTGAESFSKTGPLAYQWNPGGAQDLSALFKALSGSGDLPDHIVHGTALDAGDAEQEAPTAVYDQLIRLAMAQGGTGRACKLTVLSSGMQPLNDAPGEPGLAALVGVLRVIPTELPNVVCKSVDLAEPIVDRRGLDDLVAELCSENEDPVVAYRNRMRWVEDFTPLSPADLSAASPFPNEGDLLVTNGIQETGLMLAEHLVNTSGCRVLLVDRLFFPQPEDWDDWLRDQGSDDPIGKAIEKIRGLPSGRVRVVTANLAEDEGLAKIRAEAAAVRGLFHLDRAGEGALIQTKDAQKPSSVLAGKLRELRHIARLLGQLDFLVLFSENPAEGGIGHVEQAAAYEAVDHCAHAWSATADIPVCCIDWGTRGWEDEAVGDDGDPVQRQLREKRRLFGMSAGESMRALDLVLAWRLPRVIVSTRDYAAVLAQQRTLTAAYFQKQFQKLAKSTAVQPRPKLASEYVAPRSDIEKELTEHWAYYFGIDKVGVEDSFFELGGHSLLAVQMLNKLAEHYSVDLTVQQLFENPTIADLAVLLEGGPAKVGEDDMMRLLEEIEGLSPQEALTAIDSEAGGP